MAECPTCGTEGCYNSGFVVECVNEACSFFSAKQAGVHAAELLRESLGREETEPPSGTGSVTTGVALGAGGAVSVLAGDAGGNPNQGTNRVGGINSNPSEGAQDTDRSLHTWDAPRHFSRWRNSAYDKTAGKYVVWHTPTSDDGGEFYPGPGSFEETTGFYSNEDLAPPVGNVDLPAHGECILCEAGLPKKAVRVRYGKDANGRPVQIRNRVFSEEDLAKAIMPEWLGDMVNACAEFYGKRYPRELTESQFLFWMALKQRLLDLVESDEEAADCLRAIGERYWSED